MIAMMLSSAIASLVACIATYRAPSSSVAAPASHYKFRLIHAMNVYSVPPGAAAATAGGRASPFHQWSAIESIRRAMRYAPPDMRVDFVCAVFESDRAALLGDDLPCRTVSLTRSTRTEYHFIEDAKELPFIQDIIDAATAQDEERGNVEYFLVLTNSDIGLTKYFYRALMPHLRMREAVSINRLAVSAEAIDVATADDGETLLSRVDSALEDADDHGGYDCFIIHSSVLPRIRIGDMFAGYPPWGNVMHRLLKLVADNYTNVKSNVNGTFHIGDDRTAWKNDDWSEDELASYLEFEELVHFSTIDDMANQRTMSPKSASLILEHATAAVVKPKCPWGRGNNVYRWVNDLNCAIGLQYNRYHDNRTIPRFIQPGFEGYCKGACNPWLI
ncbi:hypothetical protein ACHAW5_004306 [Stephanodiscus triporus]|uniref:Hexosyltransferase n=1 Tax=Stephanodiscus triporus TaxID=2934178 RepID=A0ABD3QHJ4_9STRA